MNMPVTVIGAGLAGSECAWQLAKRGIRVRLIEMKPKKMSPAHNSPSFAELVCSNSMRGNDLSVAAGLLKEELRRLDSLIMECADANRVAAGGALAVDRERFSFDVTERIANHPLIEIISSEAKKLPDGETVIATGPLTSRAMEGCISELCGGIGLLRFFDAAAPIVTFESVDMKKAFFASRYGKGTPDYINCPLNREEYLKFHAELCGAKTVDPRGFEEASVFEGCLPVEVMAKRGADTLTYGPLKPVGIRDPETGKESHAIVQLRRDNAKGTIYNLVGFQTHLTFSEQKRVFSLIPALANAEFVRFGVMHRNTYINSPSLLDRYYGFKRKPGISFAGQITGVE
ncbi:MAG: methylenetetrahydrofolate--tRNA-(uracil(54)-C(5))-methyltransferase (FADH(2)-oxidizing) TrmFO, partial [Oscillospiraceae bacterium]|nr:methylenetetrahydrofolate--tRNA-(uracil(54)-C(5))-methyltransferase (FADH(2)-oxidizing) TrmFO [Oscillospiraceae bacterium]